MAKKVTKKSKKVVKKASKKKAVAWFDSPPTKKEVKFAIDKLKKVKTLKANKDNKASKKKAVVKKAGKKKVSSKDFPVGREVYLPTGGTRKLAVNELGPSLEELLRSYANEEVRHEAELDTPEAPKPSLFRRILKFLKLGN